MTFIHYAGATTVSLSDKLESERTILQVEGEHVQFAILDGTPYIQRIERPDSSEENKESGAKEIKLRLQAVNPEDEKVTLHPTHAVFRFSQSNVDTPNSNSLRACLPIIKLSDRRIVGAFIDADMLELAVSTQDEKGESVSTFIKRCTSEF